MRRRLLGALTLWLASGAGAQTLDELVAKNLVARGGAARLKSVQSLRLTGQIHFAVGVSGPFTLERKRARALRAEFTLDGARGVQAFDGKSAWTEAPGERAEPLSEPEASEVFEQADFDGPLVDWKAKGHALELLGKHTLANREVWKLRLTTSKGNLRTVFLDAQTLLEACIEGKRTLGGDEVLVESWLSDYRDVSGVKLPFRIESGAKGAPQRQRIVFERAELDVTLDDARFRMPAAR